MTTPFFSIVTPVYKSEKFFEASTRSIVSQTFSDFEFILVDDCSPDVSGVMCDELASIDSRVRVIHSPRNEGAASARNKGMDAAHGTYLLFFDADDALDVDFLDTLFRSIEEAHPQIVVWGAVEDYFDESGKLAHSRVVSLPARLLATTEEVHGSIMQLEVSTLFGYPWNKAYDLAYLRETKARFGNESILEDYFFNLMVIRSCSSMLVMEDTPYHYAWRESGGSLTKQYLPDYFELHALRVKTMLDLHEEWGIATPQVKEALGTIYLRYCLSALQRTYDKRMGMSYQVRKAWLESLFGNPLFIELVPFANASGLIARIFEWGFKGRRATFLLLGAWVVDATKTHFPDLFTRVKKSR